MKLSVIIVSYNVRFFLEQLLLSVRKASKGIDIEVFVVDNNSRDGSVNMVRQKFPEIRVIANTDNPGFSKANNQAIRQSSGEYILLLNPDTVVEEDTFRKCIRFMDEHLDAGGLGVKMIDGSGKFLPESKRGFPSPWVAFCKTFGLAGLFPKSKLFNRYHLGYLDKDETHEIDVLAGAFMMLRKNVLDKTGLLDEKFFMYGEDIDLSYRIIKEGYKNYYFPGTTIIHYKGESTRKGSLNYVKVFYNAMIIFARKHFSGEKATLFVAGLQAAIWLRAVLTVLRNLFKALWLPLTETLVVGVGLLLIKDFWAHYYFRDPNYLENPLFYYINLPLYLLMWVGGIYLSGGYEERFSIRRVIRGILAGTLLIAAIYGFLPLELRFSRALIILGAVWALLSTSSLRIFLHFLKYRNFNIGHGRPKNLIVVGSVTESTRALELLRMAGVEANFIGTVAPGMKEEQSREEDFLGSMDVLDDLVHIYRVDEIIFCSQDVESRQIMHWMTILSPGPEFRILPREGLSIIGSSSKNTAGELYTIDVRYSIATAMNRRNKRTFDIIAALFLSPFIPFLVLINARIALHWWKVLKGEMTWIGYHSAGGELENLPRLRKGVLSPIDLLRVKSLDVKTIQRLNFLYAREYSVSKDMEILLKSLRKLLTQ